MNSPVCNSTPGRHPLSLSLLAHSARGLSSTLRIFFVPFGNWWRRSVDDQVSRERQALGLVLVLPGIEGRSTLNLEIARGLVEGGVSCAVELHDWTTGFLFLSLYHLRSERWHLRQAERLAQRISNYQDEFPGRPVVLVGHSGGAALSLQALPLLKGGRQIEGAILLAAAVSPGYDTTVARRRTRNGIWSYHSPFDWLQLGLGTLAVGTYDGAHSVSAGMVGFRDSNPQASGDQVADASGAASIVDSQTRHATGGGAAEDFPASHDLSALGDSSVEENLAARESHARHGAAQTDREIAPFRQIAYRFAMLRSWNFGGHHGWANRLFAAEWLAAVVLKACRSPS